jgi:Heterokaryon incompatibility protein (HET)
MRYCTHLVSPPRISAACLTGKSASLSHQDVYGPLDPTKQEIRLLKLLPASSGDDEIQCCLRWYTFNQAPPYVALSYMWVNPTMTSTIHLGRSLFVVKRNLKAALKRLRDWGSKENYWIEALCIDQSNVKVRSNQVQLMGEMYSQCTFVFIWLGEESPESARAFFSSRNGVTWIG